MFCSRRLDPLDSGFLDQDQQMQALESRSAWILGTQRMEILYNMGFQQYWKWLGC
jgi:hypothetical protein